MTVRQRLDTIEGKSAVLRAALIGLREHSEDFSHPAFCEALGELADDIEGHDPLIRGNRHQILLGHRQGW